MYTCVLKRFSLGAGLVLAGTANGAEVSAVGKLYQHGSEAVGFRLEGDIDGADVSKVKAALEKAGVSPDQYERIVIALDSPGGSYHAGLDLALLFRRWGLATVVRSGDVCFSACAIAFLGGSDQLKDPTPPTADGPIPNQAPDRSIERDAELGFHAPYLDIEASSYTADNVAEAYDVAVQGIARFIAVADHLFVSTAELPRLLQPTRDELYMVDHVDAVRLLGIDYAHNTPQLRDLESFTPSMIVNSCINQYYHLQRRSSLSGYDIAASVRDEFIEGSKLLDNGEDGLVFGVREIKDGTGSTNVAFTPIAKTFDGRRFVWCLFGTGTIYKQAGTVEELFSEVDNGGSDWWNFAPSETTIRIGDGDWTAASMPALSMVPPDTKLTNVVNVIDHYQTTERAISRP